MESKHHHFQPCTSTSTSYQSKHQSIDPDSQNLLLSIFMIEFWNQVQVSQQIATFFSSMIEPPPLSTQHQFGIF